MLIGRATYFGPRITRATMERYGLPTIHNEYLLLIICQVSVWYVLILMEMNNLWQSQTLWTSWKCMSSQPVLIWYYGVNGIVIHMLYERSETRSHKTRY